MAVRWLRAVFASPLPSSWAPKDGQLDDKPAGGCRCGLVRRGRPMSRPCQLEAEEEAGSKGRWRVGPLDGTEGPE